MSQIFKQKSNKIVAFAFAGLIIISQLMVLNMGYQIPWYFLAILTVLCFVIIWGMLATDCMIEKNTLVIKSGPFNNKVDINKIDRLIKNSKSLIKKKNADHKLVIVYNKNRRLSIFPVDKEQMIQALKKVNPAIKIE